MGFYQMRYLAIISKDVVNSIILYYTKQWRSDGAWERLSQGPCFRGNSDVVKIELVVIVFGFH